MSDLFAPTALVMPFQNLRNANAVAGNLAQPCTALAIA